MNVAEITGKDGQSYAKGRFDLLNNVAPGICELISFVFYKLIA